jgi:hypothetical protein
MKNTINWAIGQMRNNIFVRRASWRIGVKINIMNPSADNPFNEAVIAVTDGKSLYPWCPTQRDVLALDWEWAPGQDLK